MKRTFLPATALLLASAVAGCSRQAKPQPLTPEAFISPRNGATGGGGGLTTVNPGSSTGEDVQPTVQIPANAVADRVNQTLTNPAAAVVNPAPAPSATPPAAAKSNVSDVVDNAIRPVGPLASATIPATRTTGPTATLPAIGASSGQFMTLGGMVAEVNGTPISANKVLDLLDKSFRGKAKQQDVRTFRRQAMDDIRKVTMELARNELEYAAAQRNLDAEERRYADAATIYWRQQKLTQAGGSLELARRASLADPEQPMSFEDRTAEQYRTELIKLYYQKKVYPKIQVGAHDIRDYYDRNVDKEFTENEQAEFRIVKVDIKAAGGKEAAITKVNDLLKRARGGEDFKAIAMRENHEKMFAGEKPFEVAPKSFAIVKVRDALANLNPGQVSDPIEDTDGWYVVKLDKRQGGVVHAFEEQKVQDAIRFKLKTEQFAVLRAQHQQNLMKGAIMKPDMAVLAGIQAPSPADAQMFNIALEMAMQRYAQYAAK